jgi:surfeit locus 1 family protein
MTRADAPRRRRFGIGLVAVLLGAALATGLGVWQVRRLAWKDDLIARLDAGRAGPAEPLPAAQAWTRLDRDALEYRRFSVRGRFEKAQALVFAGPVETAEGARPGYFVMSAFAPDTGGRLLVQRGVIPQELRDAAPPPPSGETTIVGLLRLPDGSHWFTPADSPDKGAFYRRDPGALAAALSPGLSPFFLDEEAAPRQSPTDWPRKGAGSLRPPNNHLSYALTWFGLALALLVVAFLRARQR